MSASLAPFRRVGALDVYASGNVWICRDADGGWRVVLAEETLADVARRMLDTGVIDTRVEGEDIGTVCDLFLAAALGRAALGR